MLWEPYSLLCLHVIPRVTVWLDPSFLEKCGLLLLSWFVRVLEEKKKTVFFVPLKSLPYHSGDKHKVLQFSTLLLPEFYDVYRVELSALEHLLL